MEKGPEEEKWGGNERLAGKGQRTLRKNAKVVALLYHREVVSLAGGPSFLRAVGAPAESGGIQMKTSSPCGYS